MATAPPTVKVGSSARRRSRPDGGSTMICNGIDTDQLAAFAGLVTSGPEAVIVSTRVRTRWEERYRTHVAAEGFELGADRIPRSATLSVDRPQELGGTDGGPAPGELILAALGSCVAQTFVEAAAMTGVRVDRLELAAQGNLDLRGNAGVEGVRPGLARIHLDVEVACDADEGVVDALLADAVRRSPIADSLAAGVQVRASVRQPHLA
ncbi:MAG: OsmC family peroxiredoxin [Nitriliruptor sp.]|nr:MAG: OsmC family peroxiredoxin [Nitriliruptor sp.]